MQPSPLNCLGPEAIAEAAPVLAQYSSDWLNARILPLGNAGGFSGARFWRLETPTAAFCLRKWPAEHPSLARLRWIHGVLLVAARSGLSFLPTPYAAASGETVVLEGGHLWELTNWQPGRADYRDSPNSEKLSSALRALARFHVAAANIPAQPHSVPMTGSVGVPDCWTERAERLKTLIEQGLRKYWRALGPAHGTTIRDIAAEILATAEARLASDWRGIDGLGRCEVRRQPVIRDVWHDHVLFQGNSVSGLVDFGAMRIDSVAADLARLLGSLALHDDQAWHQGIAAYRSVRDLSEMEISLANALEKSSWLIGGINWVTWLYLEHRRFDDLDGVEARMKEILSVLKHSRAPVLGQ